MSLNNFYNDFNSNTQQQPQQQGGFPTQFGNNQFNQYASTAKNLFTAFGPQLIPDNIIPTGNFAEKWIFNSYVRSFFDIDNMYILRKMKLILFPFLQRGEWEVKVNEYASSSQEQNFISPKDNPHSPDLYLPLMGLITFVLVSCLSVGIGDNFQPEIIQRNTSYCLFITFIEIYLYKFLFFLVGIKNIGILNMLSHLSYRFLSLTCILICNLSFGGWFTFILMVYLLTTSVFFIFKTLKRYIQTMSDSFGEVNFQELSQKNILYLMSIIQLAVSYLLLKITNAY
ncbi:Hrf1 family protein (macronuclear) [Tetrahymena thermophila SB210]|uniref:Protein YIF1 n=1 Tax=Tetrahymena thermophila (strain SB210) TaxID=312017 RepID=Q23K44_TETTS|nr:Hrf1 family protein [Tetrahymena thermophila SB210]EAR96999.1 Hrf1 family protein [Tetrahymena thermophila SB210]|eukprot:XP_001017244.1 Hrf1 family protein [Tetrahymena thermophila SB210]